MIRDILGAIVTRCITLEIVPTSADVAELADALDSGSSVRKDVEVQVLSSAPTKLTSSRQQIAIANLLATRG